MRKIINYTTFKTNADFIAWQMDGVKKQVHQVQPQLMQIGLDITEKEAEGDKNATGNGKTTFGVFVTYLTEFEDEPTD